MKYLITIVGLLILSCMQESNNDSTEWSLAKQYADIDGTWKPVYTGVAVNDKCDSLKLFTESGLYWKFKSDTFYYYQNSAHVSKTYFAFSNSSAIIPGYDTIRFFLKRDSLKLYERSDLTKSKVVIFAKVTEALSL